MFKKRCRLVCLILIPFIFLTLSLYFKIDKIPGVIFLRENKTLQASSMIKLQEDNIPRSKYLSKNNNFTVSLFGVIPIKTIKVRSVSNNIEVYPCGEPIGVKLNTKGVLVVALSDIDTNQGKVVSPAASSGIQIGDSIIKVNGSIIKDSEDLKRIVNESNGKEINLTIDRHGQKLDKKLVPIKCDDGVNYKIGLWIRDSTAGIGTLTFYDPKTKMFGALGHAITDIDTGTILSVNSGQVVPSSILSVKKGVKGTPGELKGIFVNEDNIIGNIKKNNECGIFGNAVNMPSNTMYDKPLKIALRNEIKEGSAKVLTTIEGNTPKLYDIEIVKLLDQSEPGPKSMIIKVTDPVLLEKTGGIVQGMSGSPIIQNNKLVGAVTHVLINKPEIGYGIYIEWMLQNTNILQK